MQRSQKLCHYLSCVAIVGAVFAIYWQVSSFEFLNFDDDVYITTNPYVLGGLTGEGLHWAFKATLGGHWHPLTWLSLMLDVTLFGPDSEWMHIVNLGLHALNAVFLFLLIYQVTAKMPVALVATLLFALHPLRIESVAWVSQRKDLLSLNLGLLSTLFFLTSISRHSFFLYWISIGIFALALLAKPTLVTLPVLLILLEIGVELARGRDFRAVFSPSHLRNKLPFLSVAVIVASIALLSQSTGGGLRNFNEYSVADRFNIVCTGYITYLGKLFWPFQSSVFYPIVHMPSGLALGCLISLGAMSALLWRIRCLYPEFLLAWIWFLTALVPVIGFVTVGAQAVADRWTQLAHIGPIAGIAFFSFRSKRWGRVLLWCIIPMLAYFTTDGLKPWRNSKLLFQEALLVNPNNFLAHTNLGAALNAPDERESRVHHFEEAVRLNPTYPEALNNLGIVRAEEGRFVEAKNYFERALSLNPNLTVARQNLMQVHYDINNHDIKNHELKNRETIR